MRFFLLLLIPTLSLANGYEGQPHGTPQTVNTSLGSNSNSGAVASQGNSQNLNFNSPGTQTIVSVPGLGGMYVPPASDCYVHVGASGVGVGGGGGLTAPFLSRPCNFAREAKDLASVSVAAANVAVPVKDEAGTQQALQGLTVAQTMLRCGTEDAYLTSKALGYGCAIMPDRRFFLDTLNPGGNPIRSVMPNPGYQPPAVVKYTPPPEQNYPNPNPAIDNYFQERMKK